MSELIRSGFIFWFCALTGSGMLLIQFVINIFGMGDHDNCSEATYDGAQDFKNDSGNDSGDVKKFKWVSMQAVAGFLMMFGWTALTCQNEFGLQAP